MYKWQQIKALRAKGGSIKGIARQLKLSKNTVRKYLRSSGPPEFKRRDYERMLDDYDSVIREMLGKGYIGTRIYNELREIGYKGSLSSVHRYIAGIRAEAKIRDKTTTRVETSPGRQMQYDWKEWVLSVGGKPIKVYIHEVVLSYSRKKYYTYSVRITTQDVIRAIAEGIEFFQGVPDELVIDNSKQMVITHRKDGIIRYNDEFLKFCGLYGLDPNPCANYRARTKGKAERPFYYLQEHLLKGLELEELFQFGRLLKDFTDRYNARPHSSLKESPDERFSRESKHLRSLPVVEPTVLYERQTRKVTNDGYISWDGNFYPVPMQLCMKEVMIESIFGRNVKIYDSQGEMVKEHQITLFKKGIRPDHPEHESINREYRDKKERLRSAVVERFIFLFDTTAEQYIAGLKNTVGTNLYWHLSEILACCQVYAPEVVRRALAECIHIGAYHKNSVLRLLDPLGLKCPCPDVAFSYPGLPRGEITRPLSVYAGIGEVCHE